MKHIKVTEKKYRQAKRDRDRLIKIRSAIKPINQILKNINKSK